MDIAKNRITRRRLIQLGLVSAGVALLPVEALAKISGATPLERGLSLYNQHTDESLETVYCLKGECLAESLADINHIMRDHRTNEQKNIDTRLLDFLSLLHEKLRARHPFHIVSGYRSPATNALLASRSSGVAKNSQHLYGKAIDMYVPGIDLAVLHQAAVDLKLGGVGYYPRSNFVHIDTGRVRCW